MGSSSIDTFRQAVETILGDDVTLFAFPDRLLYQAKYVHPYNLDIRTKPVAVTYPETAQQVSDIVKAAVQAGLKVQAKSGGHSYCNFSSPDGGVVIDLKNFLHYSIDRDTWKARVGAGTNLGDLTELMYNSGRRAMAHGVCPQVGIGGHATIGGLGPSSRLWGSALDHVEEVEVVLADGRIVRASESEHSDLFWALKGAGAGFGIITEFVVRTEPAPESVVQYSFSFTTNKSWKDVCTVFKQWQKFVANPDLTWKFASTANITEAGLLITGTYFGTRAEYDAIMAEAKFPGQATKSTIILKDWLGAVLNWWQGVALHLGGGVPAHSYSKTLTFNEKTLMPDALLDKMFKYFEEMEKGTPVWFAIFDLAGGYVNQIAPDATAYAHRDALFYLQSYAICVDAFQDVSATTKGFLNGLNTLITNGLAEAGETAQLGAYPGYVDLELEQPQLAYWRYNLPRLEEIKTIYDPQDTFHNPQSVRPKGYLETSVTPLKAPALPVKKLNFLEKIEAFFGHVPAGTAPPPAAVVTPPSVIKV